jgi:plasmid stabilization system protein ParE
VARIELAPDVAQDFDRIIEHLQSFGQDEAPARIEEIVSAIDVLERNPLLGRPADGDMRELVIGRRTRGYVALYRYVAELDIVFVLAIRAQREDGYRER